MATIDLFAADIASDEQIRLGVQSSAPPVITLLMPELIETKVQELLTQAQQARTAIATDGVYHWEVSEDVYLLALAAVEDLRKQRADEKHASVPEINAALTAGEQARWDEMTFEDFESAPNPYQC